MSRHTLLAAVALFGLLGGSVASVSAHDRFYSNRYVGHQYRNHHGYHDYGGHAHVHVYRPPVVVVPRHNYARPSCQHGYGYSGPVYGGYGGYSGWPYGGIGYGGGSGIGFYYSR
jgi:hypothetical protein